MEQIDKLIEKVKANYTAESAERILSALSYAEKMHDGQFRKSGEPYIIHPCAVAEILIDLGFDEATIMAALLHDIAKPATAKVKGDRLRFFYHEEKGAQMAKAVLERLHYSRADLRLICAMIGEHLRPSNLASNDVITDRGAYHFFRDLGDAGVPLLLLCWADYASYVSDAQLRRIMPKSAQRLMTIAQAQKTANVGKTLRHMQVLSLLLRKFFDTPKKVQPTRLITGRDVMAALSLPPSPKIGEILEAVAVAQVEGKVVSKEDALAFIKTLDVKEQHIRAR